jgi:hypothetical protein
VVQDGKQYAIAMVDVIPKDMLRYAKLVSSERHPAVSTFPPPGEDAGNYASRGIGNIVDMIARAPVCQSITRLDGLKGLTPAPLEDVVKDF